MNKFLGLFLLLIIGCWQTEGSAQNQWYMLWEDERPVEDFLLERGKRKDIIINSNSDIWVGFKTDASEIQFNKYFEENPITLEQEEGEVAVSSIIGAATIFKPRNNKIKAFITNSSADDFRVLIYTKDK